MTDARSKFEFRRLKVPELKHILKGKRIPYTEKRIEEFVLLDASPNKTPALAQEWAVWSETT